MANPAFLARHQLQSLFDALQSAGYAIMAPLVRDRALTFEQVSQVDQLPRGLQDNQEAGSYRLADSQSGHYFSVVNGPQGLKPLLFAPREPLWKAVRGADGRMQFEAALPEAPPLAVIGVRACDLAALALQDQHFLRGEYRDPYYAARREALFLVAVNCTRSAATCFCVSTGDGPRARQGFDIVLTELDEGFVVATGSERGAAIVSRLGLAPATDLQCTRETAAVGHAAQQQRRLVSTDVREALLQRLDHPHWQDVGERCLGCGNCTSVCPTCFCHGEVEEAALDGDSSAHYRQWDSCFSDQHSYLHGFVVRDSIALRYRQWLVHKLAGWHEQFGRSGCVGCGRCVTWCPVGIDITAEVGTILAESSRD